MSSATTPGQVLIIRHGEKLGDPSSDTDDCPDLSVQGSARAAALPTLFVPATPAIACAWAASSGSSFKGTYNNSDLQGGSPRFATPDFLFATKASHSSNRPVETITPLSIALKLTIDDKHADDDYAKVASDVLSHSRYFGKTVLICWHHGKIPDLAGTLGVDNPPTWPGDVFDRVWQISFSNGTAALTTLYQMLLYGDTAG